MLRVIVEGRTIEVPREVEAKGKDAVQKYIDEQSSSLERRFNPEDDDQED